MIYSDGNDCTKSGILGYVYMHVYRARVTAQPGLNGSYKSAASFDFTLSAMDPKRDDEKIYNIAVVKKA